MEQKILNVLMIGEDVNFTSELEEMIAVESRLSVDFEIVSDIVEGILKLCESSFEAVLLDLSPPEDSDGFETIRQIRSKAPLIPILVTSSSSDVTFAMAVIKSGAQDYLVRGQVSGKEILRSIRKAVDHYRILSAWKAVVDESFVLATQDTLTKLPNRFLFEDRLNMTLSEAKRRREIFGLFFIDLDNLKEMNDHFGHETGDEVLKTVSFRMSQSLRSEDAVARLGGDEFVACLRHVGHPDEVSEIAERLLGNLRRPLQVGGQCLTVTASVGISLYPFDGCDSATLVQHADSAMYRMKRKGGAGYEFFNKPEKWGQKEERRKGEEKEMKSMIKTTSQKILIVEDDEDVQLFLQKYLRTMGYPCISCQSVEEAVRYLRSEKPSLILLDLGFRAASGFALLQNLTHFIREAQEAPPVLIVSGYTDPEIVECATSLGAVGFIPKPVETSQLVSAVRSPIH